MASITDDPLYIAALHSRLMAAIVHQPGYDDRKERTALLATTDTGKLVAWLKRLRGWSRFVEKYPHYEPYGRTKPVKPLPTMEE